MSQKIYYVDLPNMCRMTQNEGYVWENAGTFNTKEEALSFIRENIDPNADEEGRVTLISEGEEL